MFVFGLWWCIVWLARLRFLISFVAIFTAACLLIVINDQNGWELREQSQRMTECLTHDLKLHQLCTLFSFLLREQFVCVHRDSWENARSIHVSQHNSPLCSGSHKWCPHSARTNETSPLHLYIHPEDYSGAPMSHMEKGPKSFMVKHRHCSVCGLPVNVNKTFCSPECESQNKKMNRRRTYTLIAMTVIFPLFILLMYLVPLFR